MATICPIRLPCNTRDFVFDLAKKNIGRVTTLCLGRTLQNSLCTFLRCAALANIIEDKPPAWRHHLCEKLERAMQSRSRAKRRRRQLPRSTGYVTADREA